MLRNRWNLADVSTLKGLHLERGRGRRGAAGVLDKDNLALEVQDRSKSKAARIRSEGQRRKVCIPLSSEMEVALGQGKRRHSLSPDKASKRFPSIVKHLHGNDRGRGRIVVSRPGSAAWCSATNKALQLPLAQQGIFGRGTSSGQLGDAQMRSLYRTAPGKQERSVRSASTSAPLGAGLAVAEEALKEALRSIVDRKRRADNRAGAPSPSKSRAGHPTNLPTQPGVQTTTDTKEKTPPPTPPRQQGTAAVHQHTPEREDTLPPLLAFDGNRPHRHANAWRGQHQRHETDLIQLQQSFEEAGGPDLRGSRPIDYLIRDMGQDEERTGSEEYERAAWEILRAGEAGQECSDVAEDCCGLDVRGGEEQASCEGRLDEDMDMQSDSYAGEWADYDEYLEYGRDRVDASQDDGCDDDGEAAWVDGGAGGDYDCLDDDDNSALDYIDVQQLPTTLAAHNIRAATYPTRDDLANFWQPQR